MPLIPALRHTEKTCLEMKISGAFYACVFCLLPGAGDGHLMPWDWDVCMYVCIF